MDPETLSFCKSCKLSATSIETFKKENVDMTTLSHLRDADIDVISTQCEMTAFESIRFRSSVKALQTQTESNQDVSDDEPNSQTHRKPQTESHEEVSEAHEANNVQNAQINPNMILSLDSDSDSEDNAQIYPLPNRRKRKQRDYDHDHVTMNNTSTRPMKRRKLNQNERSILSTLNQNGKPAPVWRCATCNYDNAYEQNAKECAMCERPYVASQSSNALTIEPIEPQRSYAASPLTEAQSSNAIERQRSYAAGRPIRCNSLYPVFKKEKGCVFGFHNGLEQPLYFNNHDGIYAPSSRRSNWFENVRQEVETTVESLGVMDMSTFSKILVRGEDAYQFLDTLVANQVPKKIGRVCIARMLTPSCKVTAETTICRLSKDEFYVVTGSDMERHDLREFYRHKDAQQLANVEFVSVTNDWSVLSIAGPNAEAVLSQLSYGKDVSTNELKFFHSMCMDLGTEKYGSVPNVNVMRLSF
eukprot:518231_1